MTEGAAVATCHHVQDEQLVTAVVDDDDTYGISNHSSDEGPPWMQLQVATFEFGAMR